ncbi:MAG: hypothetical protein M1828_003871 [Chrysothrix sp. TS-e1954]|nr:MAG: hypothetical protein M1828_003871 [Chrysothrix sp. TS-e1954]
MPAMLDDPTADPKYRVSGVQPYHTPSSPLPPEIAPRLVTLRDRTTAATLVPFTAPDQVSPALLRHLCDQLNHEIEKGDTYPMLDAMPLNTFGSYWFGLFAAVMILGDIQHVVNLLTSQAGEGNWEKDCLGSFYIKPNYPGRSSHICNAGFLTTNAARNRGVGRLMGEGYLEWAPKLGYTYSVFNLVYENNIASCRIWDSLGFKRIGRVKGAGNLKSFPDQLTDAIIYGRDLGIDTEDIASEERFEKIRQVLHFSRDTHLKTISLRLLFFLAAETYYLKTGQYPSDADRAQKSRLRSAAMHYKLLPAPVPSDPEANKLMLNNKEVISDPAVQASIARNVHVAQHHAGINKTTATIAETYHWTRIKETASLTIRNCPKCKELSKAPIIRPDQALFGNGNTAQGYTSVSAAGRDVGSDHETRPEDSSIPPPTNKTRQQQQQSSAANDPQQQQQQQQPQSPSSVPLDPQLLQRLQTATASSSDAESTPMDYENAAADRAGQASYTSRDHQQAPTAYMVPGEDHRMSDA